MNERTKDRIAMVGLWIIFTISLVITLKLIFEWIQL